MGFEQFSMQKSFRNGSKTCFRTFGGPQGPKIFACGAKTGLKTSIFGPPARPKNHHIRKPPPLLGANRQNGGAFLSVIGRPVR